MPKTKSLRFEIAPFEVSDRTKPGEQLMNTKALQKIALLVALLVAPMMNQAFGQAVPVDPKLTVSATMDGGTAKTGNTWYEVGVNTAAPATGLKTGIVAGQTDPLSDYLF